MLGKFFRRSEEVLTRVLSVLYSFRKLHFDKRKKKNFFSTFVTKKNFSNNFHIQKALDIPFLIHTLKCIAQKCFICLKEIRFFKIRVYLRDTFFGVKKKIKTSVLNEIPC